MPSSANNVHFRPDKRLLKNFLDIPLSLLITEKFLKKLLEWGCIASLLLFKKVYILWWNHFSEILATTTLNKSLWHFQSEQYSKKTRSKIEKILERASFDWLSIN